MEKDINYKLVNGLVKSVPMFPKGINRQLDNPLDGFGSSGGLNIDLEDTTIVEGEDKIKADKEAADKAAADKAAADAAAAGAEGNSEGTGSTAIDFTSDTFTVNDKGLLNSKGEIVKTLEELDKEGYINSDGHIIDPTSKEVKIEVASDTLPLIEEIIKIQGYTITGDDGKPKIYEDNIEGVNKYIQDLTTKRASELAKQEQEDFFAAIPEAKSYANHLLAGGTRESYFQFAPKDYVNVDLTKLDAEQKANIIYEDYIQAGIKPDRARALVKSHETAKEVDALSEESLGNLQKRQKDFDTANATRVASIREQEQKEYNEYWTKVNETLTSGKLGAITVPQAEIAGFKEFISKPIDKNGTTQHAKKVSEEGIDFQLQMAYWRYKGYDFSKLIASQVSKANVVSLRERLEKQKTEKKLSTTRDISEGGNNPTINTISLNTIE